MGLYYGRYEEKTCSCDGLSCEKTILYQIIISNSNAAGIHEYALPTQFSPADKSFKGPQLL